VLFRTPRSARTTTCGSRPVRHFAGGFAAVGPRAAAARQPVLFRRQLRRHLPPTSSAAVGRRAPATRVRAGSQRGRDLETEVPPVIRTRRETAAQVPLLDPRARSSCRPATEPAPSPARARRCAPYAAAAGSDTESQGIFSISQPCSNCHGTGTVIEETRAPRAAGTGAQPAQRGWRVNIPGRRQGGQPDPARRPRVRRPRGRSRATSTDHPRSTKSPVLQANTATTSRSRSRWTRPRGDPRRGIVRFRRLKRGTKRLRGAAPGTKHGAPFPAAARRGPAAALRKGRATSTTGFVIDVPSTLSRSSRRPFDRLSEVNENRDPRADLSRRPAPRPGMVPNGNQAHPPRTARIEVLDRSRVFNDSPSPLNWPTCTQP